MPFYLLLNSQIMVGLEIKKLHSLAYYTRKIILQVVFIE